MTTRKTRAVVEGLMMRDIQPYKCAERGAQKEGTHGVCEEGEEGGGEEVGQSWLNWHADEDIAWFYAAIAAKSFTCSVPGTATADIKKLGVRGHGGVTASREAAMLVYCM
jgi:hypothetical protein